MARIHTQVLMRSTILIGATLVGLACFYAYIQPIAWVGFVPLFVYVLSHERTAQKYAAFFFAGTMYGFVILFSFSVVEGWVWEETPIFSSFLSKYAFPAIIYISTTVLGGLFFVMSAVLFLKSNCSKYLFPVCITMSMVALEYIRVLLFGGSTVGLLGYAQTFVPFIAEYARFGTVFVVSGILIYINAVIALGIHLYQHDDTKRTILYIYGITVIILCIGGMYLSTLAPQYDEYTGLYGIDLPFTTEETDRVEVYHKILETIDATLHEKRPDLVLLPENAFSLFVLRTSDYLPFGYEINEEIRTEYDDFLTISKRYPETIITVGVHTGESKEKMHNSLVFIQNAEVIATYNKRHLLPFGEHPVPLLSNYTQVLFPGDVTEIHIVDEIITPYVCSEAFYLHTGPRPTFVIHSSNESMFRHPFFGKYTNNGAHMRAIEKHAPLVRARKYYSEHK